MEPLISVIVPVYNVEPYLRKCVDSILNQTYRNLEVILVDDGSPDACPAICDEYAAKDDRVRVIHKRNEGQAIARNTALKIVTGDYVAFVDSDDWIDLRLYETVMQYAPFEVVLFGCTYVNAQTGECVVKPACDCPCRLCWNQDIELTENILRNSLFGYACNKVYSRTVLTDLCYPNVPLREDLLFNIEVCSRTDSIKLVNCAGYFYNQHESSSLRKSYSGVVPDIVSAARQMMVVHPALPEDQNRRLANILIKQYICDALYKHVFMNQALSQIEIIDTIRSVFSHRPMAKYLRYYADDNKIFKLLTICCKFRLPVLFFYLMRTKWHRHNK